jgi:hypothetical protein
MWLNNAVKSAVSSGEETGLQPELQKKYPVIKVSRSKLQAVRSHLLECFSASRNV